MNGVFDFWTGALPWIAIGLFVSTSCAMIKAKTEEKEADRFLKGMCRLPALCFLLIAIMEMLDGNRSGGTTWLVLGVFSAVLNFADA